MAGNKQGIPVLDFWDEFILQDGFDTGGVLRTRLLDPNAPVTDNNDGTFDFNFVNGNSVTSPDFEAKSIISGTGTTVGNNVIIDFNHKDGTSFGVTILGAKGNDGADAPYDLIIFAQFPEATTPAAPTGGSYTQSTGVLDLDGINPSNWREDTTGETLQTGNSWYSATFRVLPRAHTGSDRINISSWESVQERTGETGPQGRQGLQGPPGENGFTPRISDNGDGTAAVDYIVTPTPPQASTLAIPQGEQGPQPPFRISLYRNGTASSVFIPPTGVVYDITNGTVDISTIPSPWSLNRTDDAANPVRWESESDFLNPSRFGALTFVNMTFQTVFQEVEGTGGGADNIEVRITGVTDTDTNIVYNASNKANTDLANVDSDLLGAEQLAFRNKVGAGDIRTNPTLTQIITQPTGTQLEFRGSIDFEDRDGNKALDFSGTSGDFHFEHEGEVYGLVDKDQKKIYYDTTNTATSFPTTGRAGKEIVIKDDLTLLADEITAIEIQRNSAGQSLEQWEDLGNSASTFVADPSNSLTEVSLANNLNLLANDSYSKMIVATENGNNYHFDLLRFQSVGGRLVLQTDNLVTRLANIDSEIASAGVEEYRGDWPSTYSTQFALDRGAIWRNDSELWLYTGATITIDSTGDLNTLEPTSNNALWEQITGGGSNITVHTTNGVTDTDTSVTYNAGNKVNKPTFHADYDKSTYLASAIFINDDNLATEEIQDVGLHYHTNGTFEAVGDFAFRQEDTTIVMDINTADTGDVEIYGTGGNTIFHSDFGTDKVYYNPGGIDTNNPVATHELATKGDLAGISGNATVRVIQPTGPHLTEVPTFDTGGGSANEGQWYWREAQGTNTVLNPSSWEDLVVANGNANTRHQIVFDVTTDQDGNVTTLAPLAVAQGYLFVATATGSAILGVSRFSGAASNDFRFDISSVENSVGTPGFSGAIRMSQLGFASVGNDDRVPNGIGNGHMLVWDHDLGIWREVSIIVDGIDDDGADEPQSFGLNSIAEGVERRVTTREWQETNLTTSFRIPINNTGDPTNIPAGSIAIVSSTQQYYNITAATIEVPVQASLSDATTYFNNALQWVQVGDGGGSNANDPRFDGTPEGLDHSDTGVTVGAVIDYNDPSTDTPYTIILPSADTHTFAVGQGISATDEGTTYTIVRLQPTSTVTEFYIQGHHAAEFPAGTTLFVSEDGHKQGSIWTLPTQGATAYTQDDNVLNDLLAKEAALAEQVQANSTAIAAFQADLVSIAAYQPQGAYLSGAGDITPSFATDTVDRSGSKTGTGYANTGQINVYHDGRVEVIGYLLMPEGTNTDGTGTNAPSIDYVAAFEEQFKTEDIIGFALVSGAYNTQGFPHIINTVLETKYDNGHGTGLKAYFLGGVYQGRVEVRFQGTLTPSQNSDRTFITDHSDNTILYDNYTSYQIYPTNAFWHNTRIADPEQIFLIKEGVYLLHEIADAAVPANIGKVLSVTQDQNRVDTFNFPAGSNLSGDLSFTLSRPPSGNVTFSTVTGATITNTGSLVTFDYTGTVAAGSFTATYATTGIEALAYTGEFDNFKQGGYWNAWFFGTELPFVNQTIDGLTVNYTSYSNITGFDDIWYNIDDVTINASNVLIASPGNSVWTTVTTGVGDHASSFNF